MSLEQRDRQNPDKIDLLIDRVGKLTEGITEMRISLSANLAETREVLSASMTETREALSANMTETRAAMTEGMDDLTEGFKELKESSQQLYATNERQAKNIEHLAVVAASLVAATDRQWQMLENLLQACQGS